MSNVTITTGSDARWREELAKLAVWAWWLISGFAILSMLLDATGTRIAWDDTDGPVTRSGLGLYTDNGTGCQYLGRLGALTPRMNGTGKQMGCRS